MEQISIVIPTWERVTSTIEAFISVHDDQRISLIHIVDDHSSIEVYEELKWWCNHYSKIRVYRNEKNLNCYANKREAISKSLTDFCLLADSDNVFTTDYIDKLYQYEWDKNTIFTPSFASPYFDFRAYEGLTITKENVSEYIDKPLFEVMCNAANYFCHRDSYLEVWDGSVNPVTSDSIFQVYNWLKSGRSIFVVPGLTYTHNVHPQSHYITQNKFTPPGFHENILAKIRKLSNAVLVS